MYDRAKPANHEAEKALLGAVILGDQATMDRAMEIIREPEAFDLQTNRAIWNAMTKLREDKQPIDLVTLHTALGSKFDTMYLATLPNIAPGSMYAIPSTENIEQYAQMVWDQYIRRRAIQETEATWDKLYSGEDPRETISASMLTQSKILEGDTRRGLVPINQGLMSVLDTIESRKNEDGITGVPTGYLDMDRLLGGLDGLILLAARPSVGKTTFAQNIAGNIGLMAPPKGKEPNNAYIFSLEMSKEQLMEKFLAMQGKIDSYLLRASSRMTDDEWGRVANAAGRLNSARIFIDDTPGLRVSELAVKLRRARSLYGPGVCIIDYLQLMNADGKTRSRYEAVTEISRSLKALAKEIMPIMALSQLSRIKPDSEGKVREPNLPDLRESGSLEQDADVVVFLHRDDYESKENTVTVNSVTQAIVAKNRMGSVGRLSFVFNKPESKFSPMILRGQQEKDPKREWA
jgi:replicative DNA helicase